MIEEEKNKLVNFLYAKKNYGRSLSQLQIEYKAIKLATEAGEKQMRANNRSATRTPVFFDL